MNRARSLLIVFAALAWLTVAPRPASAEFFADIHLGAAITQGADVTFDEPGEATVTTEDVDFDNSFSIGGRVGYWFETPPLRGVNLNIGGALDVSHFSPDIGTQAVTATQLGVSVPAVLSALDLSVTAISFDLMLRWPLMVSREFPKGQLQPYFTVGPTIFVASTEDSLILASNFDPPGQSETDASIGVKLGLGAAWLFLKNVAILGEYRFTHFSPEFTFSDGFPPVPVTVETDVNTHSFLVGASYRF